MFLEDPDTTASFFFHSYDEDCDGCIFQPKTTLAMGRNIALKAATQSPLWNDFKYIVMFDDDITLMHMKTVKGVYKPDPANKSKSAHQTNGLEKTHPELIEQSWKELHRMLLDELTYPLWKPRDLHFDYWRKKVHGHSYQSCVDDNFWVIRRDHIDFLYPFSTIHESENFWLNAFATFMKMEKCFPAGWWVDHRFMVENPAHRYDQAESPPETEQWLREIMDATIPNAGPWHYVPPDIGTAQGCTIKQAPSFGVHPACKQETEKRFQKWVSGELEP
jgi:hypothetical protein